MYFFVQMRMALWVIACHKQSTSVPLLFAGVIKRKPLIIYYRGIQLHFFKKKLNSGCRCSSTFLLIKYSILDEIEINRSVLHLLRFPIYYNSLWLGSTSNSKFWLVNWNVNSYTFFDIFWLTNQNADMFSLEIHQKGITRITHMWKPNRCTYYTLIYKLISFNTYTI